jgi:hypothetical protein
MKSGVPPDPPKLVMVSIKPDGREVKLDCFREGDEHLMRQAWGQKKKCKKGERPVGVPAALGMG